MEKKKVELVELVNKTKDKIRPYVPVVLAIGGIAGGVFIGKQIHSFQHPKKLGVW